MAALSWSRTDCLLHPAPASARASLFGWPGGDYECLHACRIGDGLRADREYTAQSYAPDEDDPESEQEKYVCRR